MYDRMVDEPRLTAWYGAAGFVAPGLPPVVPEMAAALSARYDREFDGVGAALYRDGRDSVAWHGDRIPLEIIEPIVALVSLGSPRVLRMRNTARHGDARSFRLTPGDLFVMGGSSQRTWEHAVPKVAAPARASASSSATRAERVEAVLEECVSQLGEQAALSIVNGRPVGDGVLAARAVGERRHHRHREDVALGHGEGGAARGFVLGDERADLARAREPVAGGLIPVDAERHRGGCHRRDLVVDVHAVPVVHTREPAVAHAQVLDAPVAVHDGPRHLGRRPQPGPCPGRERRRSTRHPTRSPRNRTGANAVSGRAHRRARPSGAVDALEAVAMARDQRDEVGEAGRECRPDAGIVRVDAGDRSSIARRSRARRTANRSGQRPRRRVPAMRPGLPGPRRLAAR